MKMNVLAATAVALVISSAAGAKTVSGTSNGLTWTAQNNIIGQTSTATQAPPTPPGMMGNPIYWAHSPVPGYDNSKYSGVVALILDEGAAGKFICSGSLLADRIHVLTAGHCVSSGHGAITPISATATFYGGTDPEAVIGTTGTPAAGAVRINVAAFSVNPLYTGDVIDSHDIAIVTLAQAAPAFATGYRLDTTSNLVGANYNIAGYGGRSDQGGSVGVNLGTGRLRQGDNRYDTRLGDSVFQGVLDASFFGGTTGETAHSYISDFDNGLAQNDSTCLLVTQGFGGPASPKYCNTGRGASEVSSAGGDSGGPQFLNGKISSVTSYGLTFGLQPYSGDIDNKLNDTFGELNGFAPVQFNANYINSVTNLPEPAEWALMLGGFGLLGGAARRRRTTVSFA
ncbi:Peptidase S1 domain-containing protein [Sphingomonas antarctica]|uniref:trypsin-like serine protease n=1 Tax=Sphingomonas antarctica TaxID=2040274 RepID=UPI0039EA5853